MVARVPQKGVAFAAPFAVPSGPFRQRPFCALRRALWQEPRR